MNRLKLKDVDGKPVLVFVDHMAMVRSPRGGPSNVHSEIVTDGTAGNIFVRETIEQIEAKLNGDE